MKLLKAIILFAVYFKINGNLIASYPDGSFYETPLNNQSSIYTTCRSGGWIVLSNPDNFERVINLSLVLKPFNDCKFTILNYTNNLIIPGNSFKSIRLSNYSFFEKPNINLFEFKGLGDFYDQDDGLLFLNNNCIK